jgi:glutathione S-transferase
MNQPAAKIEQPVRLITIPVSHYCEKIRWALNRLQIPFVEEPHMPPFHRWATSKVGGGSVPVLISGVKVLTDSEEILRYLEAIAPEASKLYPSDAEDLKQIEKLVKSFDSVLAPAVRNWFYFYAFDHAEIIRPLWCQGVPWYESILFPLIFGRLRTKVFEMYKINAASAASSRARISNIFETVNNLLSDGRTYLVGDRFSAADLAFATLAAAVVMPANYGVKLPKLTDLPIPLATDIRGFQATLAGKFVLRLYQESLTHI